MASGANDDAFKCVSRVLDLVDSVPVVRLEADLSAICPRAFHPGIVGEGAEDGMVGRREIFKYRVAVANAMSGKVSELGQGVLLVAENNVADELG